MPLDTQIIYVPNGPRGYKGAQIVSGTLVDNILTITLSDNTSITIGPLQIDSATITNIYQSDSNLVLQFSDGSLFTSSTLSFDDKIISVTQNGNKLILHHDSGYLVTSSTLSFNSVEAIYATLNKIGVSLSDGTQLYTSTLDSSLTNSYPSTGGTLNGNLILDGGYIKLSTTISNPSYAEGKVFYDNTEKTLSYYNEQSDVTVNLGQELLVRVINKSGATISNGTVVSLYGFQGNRPKAWIASSAFNATPTMYSVIGISTHDIENNTEGYITVQGVVNGVDTSNLSPTISEIYLDPFNPGKFTSWKPSNLYKIIPLGYALNNTNNGRILVKIHNPTNHDDLIGLLGGDNNGRYHLDTSKYNLISSLSDSLYFSSTLGATVHNILYSGSTIAETKMLNRYTISYNYGGLIETNVVGKLKRVIGNKIILKKMIFSLSEANISGTTLDIDIIKNGVPFPYFSESFNIGEIYKIQAVESLFAEEDFITVNITQNGYGASDLSILFIFDNINSNYI